MSENVAYSSADEIVRLTLDRPEVNNCLDIELLDQWLAALDRIEADDDCKAVTLRGASGNFSAGADLAMFLAAIRSGDRETIDKFIRKIHRVTARLEELDIPVLAVVEGFALAGGLEILLACDLRLASTEATIGDQHANYGLVAGGGGTQRLVRQIGTARANDLMYTGRRISGAEAADWGLVSRAVPPAELDAAQAELEESLRGTSRDAASLTKHLMREGTAVDLEHGLALERHAVVDHYFTEDAKEGFRAFDEDRSPEF